MKITFVTPRYGTEILGGAEHAARMLAERLALRDTWQVRAKTSCATDAATWQNEYPEGTSEINGVIVERFAAMSERSASFLDTSARVHANPRFAPRDLQERWITEQGPCIPSAIDAIRASDDDITVFYPYLYYPTVYGIRHAPGISVLHPAAHDELPIRMSVFQSVFLQADALVFQTEGERRLVQSLFPVDEHPQLSLGLGVEPQGGDEAGFRRLVGVGDRPYVLCLGRVDPGKGATLLATYFAAFKDRFPSELQLVFAGPVVEAPPAHPDIIMAGPVSDAMKWGALSGAQALISPSPFEAFSLVLLESWSVKRPVLVNRACLATNEHVVASGGGLSFDGYSSFESAFNQFIASDTLRNALGGRGFDYVTSRYSWPALIDRYADFLTWRVRCASAHRDEVRADVLEEDRFGQVPH